MKEDIDEDEIDLTDFEEAYQATSQALKKTKKIDGDDDELDQLIKSHQDGQSDEYHSESLKRIEKKLENLEEGMKIILKKIK